MIDPVTERNAFFFVHPQNLLFRMIVVERTHIRELGFRKIIKARKFATKTEPIRRFRTSNINFQASNYIKIIDWNTTFLKPPPLLKKFSDDEVKG